MFDSDDYEGDDLFKFHGWHGRGVMDLILALLMAAGAIVVLALLCRCCRSKYNGRVLQPPPGPDSAVPAPPGAAPYPQQQYSTVTVTSVPVGPYPTGGVLYPGAPGAPYPAPGAAYPTAGAPYPNAGGPYPGAAPYPMAGAPYPAVAPYSPAAPAPYASAPSAPDAQALPPTYDQVMSNEGKHPPYNPYAPH